MTVRHGKTASKKSSKKKVILIKGAGNPDLSVSVVPMYVAVNGELYKVKGANFTTAWLKDGRLSMEHTEDAEPVPIQLINFEQ